MTAGTAVPAGTVTFLLTDIEGSTRAWEAGPESMRAALARHDALVGDGIDAHRGTVLTERGEGDSFFAVFARASDAVSAACAIQQALVAESWPEGIPVRVRMAIHTGEAGDDVRGPEVNRCARIRGLAAGGQVLVSLATHTLVRDALRDGAGLIDLGEHRLRDLTRPERLFQLTHPAMPVEFPQLRSLDASANNLPVQTTSFVGREAALTTIRDLLERSRLVTLTGAGGCGKTRLALQAAAELLDSDPDGVWFVELAPITMPDLVVVTVAAALGVQDNKDASLLDAVIAHAKARHLLIVLDNCEHLLDSCAQLGAALLRVAPGLRLLVTSREPLGIEGETAWRVPSLGVPDVDGKNIEATPGGEALELFVERAAAARPGYSLGATDAATITEICRRLDGVPLAIELAAARVRYMTPRDILRRLEDRFTLLVGGSRAALPRQQTLRATVDWSYDLLTEPERVVFRRLCVFAGGFTVEAAEAVCAGADIPQATVLDVVAQLVDRSLLVVDADIDEASVRYRMLEILRQYARERLIEAGEADQVAVRHLDHFVNFAETMYPGTFDADATALDAVEREHDNLRAALEHAMATDSSRAVQLAGALAWFWQFHAHLQEGWSRLSAILDPRPAPGPHAARALRGAGKLLAMMGREGGTSWLEESLAMWRQLQDDAQVAVVLEDLGWARFFNGDDPGALESFQAALDMQVEFGDPRRINRARLAVCQVLVAMHDLERSDVLAAQALAEAEAEQDLRGQKDGHHYLADAALIRGDCSMAEIHYLKALELGLQYGDLLETSFEMQGAGMAAAGLDRPLRALRLGGAAQALHDELGFELDVPFWLALLERWLGAAREVAGESAAVAWEEGRRMGFRAVADYALAVAD